MTGESNGQSVLSLEFFKGFVEYSSIGMAAFSDKEQCLFVNGKARESLEIRDGSSWVFTQIIPEPGRAAAYKELSRETLIRDGMTSEVLMRKLNGHHFLANVSVRKIEVSGQTVTLFTFQDITIERKLAREITAKQEEITRAYQELLEQNSQLKELDQAKDKFIALTTHELRTPLSAILATAEVLELQLYESEEQKEEFIKTIGEQGRHLMELVNDILDFARIRAGKMDFYVESIALKPLVLKLVQNFQHMAEQSKVSITCEITDGPEVAWADLLRLKEVINNVVSNAIKYNRSPGTVVLKIAPFTRADGRRLVRLTCKDTGHGIPADKTASVFNEFETVGHVSKHHKGTGLGMPISRRLMEQMGGDLLLESEVGVGSQFHIDIPLDKVLAEEMYKSRPDMADDLAA